MVCEQRSKNKDADENNKLRFWQIDKKNMNKSEESIEIEIKVWLNVNKAELNKFFILILSLILF